MLVRVPPRPRPTSCGWILWATAAAVPGCFNPSDTAGEAGTSGSGTAGSQTSHGSESATSSMLTATEGTSTSTAGSDTDASTSSAGTSDTGASSGESGSTVCDAGSFACDGDNLQICRADGSGFDHQQRCDPGLCDDAQGQCDQCIPRSDDCASANSLAQCSPDGQQWNVSDCDPATPYCVDPGACVQCVSEADCTASSTCEQPVCDRGTCGTAPLPQWTDCGFPQVCDGAGNCDDDPRKILAASEQGMRSFDGGTNVLALTFTRVFPGTEDRFVAHYNVSSVPATVPNVHLILEMSNSDPGGADGSVALYIFHGDGVGSIDEWNAGTQAIVVGLLQQSYEMRSVDLTSYVQAARDANAPFLSIVYRPGPGSTDRISFGAISGLTPPYLIGDTPLIR